MPSTEEQKFRNVGLLVEDHDKLRQLAEREQRSMARQLSVLIRQAMEDTALPSR